MGSQAPLRRDYLVALNPKVGVPLPKPLVDLALQSRHHVASFNFNGECRGLVPWLESAPP